MHKEVNPCNKTCARAVQLCALFALSYMVTCFLCLIKDTVHPVSVIRNLYWILEPFIYTFNV